MDIIIDRDGNLAFDEYFGEEDAETIREFLRDKLGIDARIVRNAERQFKAIPALWKKRNLRDIDWADYKNILILLRNEDKMDDEILELLGAAERESAFVIVTRMRAVRQRFKAWAREEHLDDSLEEHMLRFAQLYASQQKKTNKQISYDIDQMVKDGCKQLEDKGDRFPECEDKFNKNCITCVLNKHHIKDTTDIERYNQVLAEEYEEE